MKLFLTLFWTNGGDEHLYKDVGGIPFALSKYCGWSSTFAYSNYVGEMHNSNYECYTKLEPIKYFASSKKHRTLLKLLACKYVWDHIKEYDVLNLYHYNNFNRFLCKLAKLRNPNVVTYIKMDMGRGVYERELKKQDHWIYNFLFGKPDLFTVETKRYVEGLYKLPKFDKRLRYLPNGFFDHLLLKNEIMPKENIILTVGRLGTDQKNTELLVEAFIELNKAQKLGYKLYLVGSMTDRFKKWLLGKFEEYVWLEKLVVITGNISDKNKLYRIYAKAKIFVLPSRAESWGLVLNEAMYYKNYCIVTDVCDAYKDFLYDGEKPLASIIPSENKEALVLELREVIKNYDVHAKVAEEASIFINENFNWCVIIKKLEQYVNSITM